MEYLSSMLVILVAIFPHETSSEIFCLSIFMLLFCVIMAFSETHSASHYEDMEYIDQWIKDNTGKKIQPKKFGID